MYIILTFPITLIAKSHVYTIYKIFLELLCREEIPYYSVRDINGAFSFQAL